MNIVQTVTQLQEALASLEGKTIGLVPTMGYLHAGHLSLIEAARRECDCVVVSIFVNPLQFGPQEDLDAYPRDLTHDRQLAEQTGTDILFTPTVKDMYPQEPLTNISVTKVTDGMCGAKRPGHFDGVATVVMKLFNLVRPEKAFFGLKDIQQAAVIKQMVADLNVPVTVMACPTVREADGLAMSSRNVYLSQEERQQAAVLYRALSAGKELLLEGKCQLGKEIENKVAAIISTQPLAVIEYVEMRSFPEMKRIDVIRNGTYVIAAAVKFGRTRLIDNVVATVEGESCTVQ